ncbi:Dynactin subunit 3 [Acipenser ruthenus]|uniref:Dynactin subunit 3 n=1 Tax=Acipenser ruthenus TaxID=7906 RepID=A0A444U675_ACIRT|nr:Dynactin subunit 3 [Acipenser ruthenus]
MPGPLRKCIGQNDPSTIDDFVSLVERQLAKEELARAPPMTGIKDSLSHGRPKTLPGMVEDLLKYLDPQFIDKITVPDAIKVEFILAEEEFILSQASLLEQLSGLRPLLDSSHIKVVPEHASKLQSLSQIHVQQQDQCKDLTKDVKMLFEDYNKMVSFTASS